MLFWIALPFLISQLLAWTAIIADLCSFQFKERKKIIIFFIISSLCIGIHYYLLERYLPAFIAIPVIIRFFIWYYSTNRYWMPLFIAIFIGSTIFLYKDIYDLLVLTAAIFATFWSFQTWDKNLRLYMMWATVCFLIYNIAVFSPVGIIWDISFLWSNLVGYYRYYIKK